VNKEDQNGGSNALYAKSMNPYEGKAYIREGNETLDWNWFTIRKSQVPHPD
jgi:hypothetical protein